MINTNIVAFRENQIELNYPHPKKKHFLVRTDLNVSKSCARVKIVKKVTFTTYM